jgi:hypothetical protein
MPIIRAAFRGGAMIGPGSAETRREGRKEVAPIETNPDLSLRARDGPPLSLMMKIAGFSGYECTAVERKNLLTP